MRVLATHSIHQFPFTSPPVRHRVPPGSERALAMQLVGCWVCVALRGPGWLRVAAGVFFFSKPFGQTRGTSSVLLSVHRRLLPLGLRMGAIPLLLRVPSWGAQGSYRLHVTITDCEDYGLVLCDAVQFLRWVQMFRGTIFLPKYTTSHYRKQ